MDVQKFLDSLLKQVSTSTDVLAPDGTPVHPLIYKENQYGPAVSVSLLKSLRNETFPKNSDNQFCSWNEKNEADKVVLFGLEEYPVSKPMFCKIKTLVDEVNKVNNLTTRFLQERSDHAVELLQSNNTQKKETIQDLRSVEMNRQTYTVSVNRWVGFLLGVVVALYLFTVIYHIVSGAIGGSIYEILTKNALTYLLLPLTLIVLIGYGYLFIPNYTIMSL